MNTESTPTPWHVGMKPGPIIYDASGNQIVDMRDPSPNTDNLANKANARHIVRCVNSHEDLLAALQRTLNWLASYPGGCANGCYEQAREAIKKATS